METRQPECLCCGADVFERNKGVAQEVWDRDVERHGLRSHVFYCMPCIGLSVGERLTLAYAREANRQRERQARALEAIASQGVGF